MGDLKTDDNLYLKHIYLEYERLHHLWDSYSKSSFDDFKLLGAVGLIIAWGPITKCLSKENTTGSSMADPTIFFGFLGILFIIAIIGIRDLLKQSIIVFCMKEIRHYENELSSILQNQNTHLFCISNQWRTWFRQKHSRIAFYFYLLCLIFSLIYPTAIMSLMCNNWIYPGIYLGFGIILSIFSFKCIYVIYKNGTIV